MKWLLLLHIVGAVMFVGNVVTAAFWKIRAERNGDVAHIHRTAKGVMAADLWFTIPGIVLIVATGEAMTARLGYSHSGLSWLTVAMALFALTGVLWVAILLPNQQRMIRESALSMEQGKLTAGYRRASRLWDVVGSICTLLPLAVLLLMVVKPG